MSMTSLFYEFYILRRRKNVTIVVKLFKRGIEGESLSVIPGLGIKHERNCSFS